jgi:hypothetical protein
VPLSKLKALFPTLQITNLPFWKTQDHHTFHWLLFHRFSLTIIGDAPHGIRIRMLLPTDVPSAISQFIPRLPIPLFSPAPTRAFSISKK